MESEVDEEESRDSGGSECERCQENEVVGFGVGYAGDTQGSRNYKITSSKGKYYKQTYRTAWEQMPDFKGEVFGGRILGIQRATFVVRRMNAGVF